MKQRPDNSTPALILKLGTHGSLGIMRTLGRMGVPVYGVHPDRNSPSIGSRYCRRTWFWDFQVGPAEKSVEFLLSIAKRLGQRMVLIPTSDEGAVFASVNCESLRECFIFQDNPAALVQSLVSKKEMYSLALEHGIPTAKTDFPQSRADVVRYLDSASFPIMLKGIDGDALKRRSGVKMSITTNRKQLLDFYDAFEDGYSPNVMLQEYIPGGEDSVWMFNGYFNELSECKFAATGKKLRQSPVYIGMTSLGICLRNPEVEQTTLRFMRAIGYRGILDIGYRFDERDRLYKVLDINPRCGATFRLFAGSDGMDVVRALYLDLTGQTVPPSNMQDGRKWLVEDTDLRSSIKYHCDGLLNWTQWLHSLRGVRECAYFASDDPVPFLQMLFRVLTDFAKSGSRRPTGRTAEVAGPAVT